MLPLEMEYIIFLCQFIQFHKEVAHSKFGKKTHTKNLNQPTNQPQPKP